jgi:hypothetical protein
MKLNNRSYVDEAMREKHSDIFCRTKINGKTEFYTFFCALPTFDRHRITTSC